jgi:peptide deformylase
MATKKTNTEEPSGYAEAMREVETILGELDSNNVDVDVLATKVRRASYLITWCNDRIAAAQLTVDTLVADLGVDEEYGDEEDEEPDPKAAGIENFKKVFINPIIEEESGVKWAFQEGCLSIPGIRENVQRPEQLLITYYDENWNFHEETYDGYAARIIQHEYDHIEGVLFTDHLSPLKKKLLLKRLANISLGAINVDYKMSFPGTKKQRMI